MGTGTPQSPIGELLSAGNSAVASLLGERTTGEGGLIVLDSQGRVGYARNSATMVHAYMHEGMDAPFAGV
jgi:isoaspartyl peptidase/L-asparaginase-like protein (Ntn-hydrolase superfamily)